MSSTTLFRKYDERVVQAIKRYEMMDNDGTWQFDTNFDMIDIDYSLYGNLDDNKIIEKEKQRLRKEYEKSLPGREIRVEYDGWFDQIYVFWKRDLKDKLEDDTKKAMDFIYNHHLWISNEPETLRRVIVDDSINAHIPHIGSPSGRADIITHLSINGHVEAIPELREVVLHDNSLLCRHEAIKGLFRLGADASIFSEAAQCLPLGLSENHQIYRQAVFVLAGVKGVPGFEDYVSYEADYLKGVMSSFHNNRLINEASEPQTMNDDLEF